MRIGGNQKFSNLPDENKNGIPDLFENLLKTPRLLIVYFIILLFVGGFPVVIALLVLTYTKPGKLFLKKWKQAIKGQGHSGLPPSQSHSYQDSGMPGPPDLPASPVSPTSSDEDSGDGIRILLLIVLVIASLLFYFRDKIPLDIPHLLNFF